MVSAAGIQEGLKALQVPPGRVGAAPCGAWAWACLPGSPLRGAPPRCLTAGCVPGRVCAQAGGTPPRLLIIDDGWQATDVDAPFRAVGARGGAGRQRWHAACTLQPLLPPPPAVSLAAAHRSLPCPRCPASSPRSQAAPHCGRGPSQRAAHGGALLGLRVGAPMPCSHAARFLRTGHREGAATLGWPTLFSCLARPAPPLSVPRSQTEAELEGAALVPPQSPAPLPCTPTPPPQTEVELEDAALDLLMGPAEERETNTRHAVNAEVERILRCVFERIPRMHSGGGGGRHPLERWLDRRPGGRAPGRSASYGGGCCGPGAGGWVMRGGLQAGPGMR